jgi:DegV family protein with EDD domain
VEKDGYNGVAVVTDSAACLPRELAESHDIEVVPMEFIHEGKVYRDGIDITPAQFYDLLPHAKKLPRTSAPSPNSYLTAFQSLVSARPNILVVTPSSKFTHAFISARAAAQMAKQQLPQATVEVLDSGTAAGAQGLVVLTAARAANSGSGLNETVSAARNLMPRVRLIAYIDTLRYLAKGGRVPRAVSWASSILKIRPIFELLPQAESATLLDRVRHKAKARLVEIIRKGANHKPVHAMVMHTNEIKGAEELRQRIASQLNCSELHVADFTPVMAVHTGPGLLGVAYHFDEA